MKLEKNNSEETLLRGLRKLSYLMYAAVALFLSLFLVGVVLLWGLPKIGVSSDISGALASQLSIAFFALILFSSSGERIIDSLKDFSFKIFWYGVRLTVIVLILNIVATQLFSTSDIVPETTQNVIAQKSFILTFLLPVLVAPFFEELAFRAGLKSLLVDMAGLKPISYILISSLVFGLLHWVPGSPTALTHVIFTFSMGIAYSFTYLKFNNIYISIVSHMLYNGLVIMAASLL